MLKRILARLGTWFALLFSSPVRAALPEPAPTEPATPKVNLRHYARLTGADLVTIGRYTFDADAGWYELTPAMLNEVLASPQLKRFDLHSVDGKGVFTNADQDPPVVDVSTVQVIEWSDDLAPPRRVELESTPARRWSLRLPVGTPAWPSESRDAGEMLVRVKPGLGTKTVTPVGWHTLESDRWYVIGPKTAELLRDVETLQVVTRDEAQALNKFQPHATLVFVPPPRRIGQSVDSWTAERDEAKRQHDLRVELLAQEVELLGPPASPTRPPFDNTPDGRPEMLVRIKPTAPTKSLTILADRSYSFRKGDGWYKVTAKVADLCDRDTLDVCTQEQALAIDAYEALRAVA